MYSALINDQMDFVELFMDNGCSLREFLTLKTMLQLYNNVWIFQENIIKYTAHPIVSWSKSKSNNDNDSDSYSDNDSKNDNDNNNNDNER